MRRAEDARTRRDFLRLAGGALAGAACAGRASAAGAPETHVQQLYATLTPAQREVVAFPWDHRDPRRGLLRSHVANNWRITEPSVDGGFFSGEQRALIRSIYEGLYSPEWVERIDAQLEDDAGGWGRHQSIAIFGEPGGRFEFVMTGRHLTMRCDGNSAEHLAFGGPIFYGHAADGFREGPAHPGNVFWPQALEANRVFEMLDGAQRERALVERAPRESAVAFRGPAGPFPGIPIAELAADQKEQVQRTLRALVEPYRTVDRREVVSCLDAQGGLDACSLAFYRSGDIGGDGVWDNWRVEGPSFVWYFRGAPHVHVWVNVAADPAVETNTSG